jgi:hypothetical protein
MIKFWIIAVSIYVLSTYILAKYTLKSNREETGEHIWRFGNGRSTYWRILTLCSFAVTVVLLFILHLCGISIV